jgi:holo-[acyl-carrier protein] synthase
MSPPGVGIDLIEIERLERALARRPSLLERLFREHEIEACATRARPGRHLAARFAAKEAALKALGIGGLRMREVEVVDGNDRPPRLVLHESVALEAEHQGVELTVSLSHSRELATAVVVAERPG